MTNEITFKVIKPLEVLSKNDKGYTKEVNIVSWNDAPAKIDIRQWKAGHERCGKGVTISESEGRELMNALIKFYDEKDNAN